MRTLSARRARTSRSWANRVLQTPRLPSFAPIYPPNQRSGTHEPIAFRALDRESGILTQEHGSRQVTERVALELREHSLFCNAVQRSLLNERCR